MQGTLTRMLKGTYSIRNRNYNRRSVSLQNFFHTTAYTGESKTKKPGNKTNEKTIIYASYVSAMLLSIDSSLRCSECVVLVSDWSTSIVTSSAVADKDFL